FLGCAVSSYGISTDWAEVIAVASCVPPCCKLDIVEVLGVIQFYPSSIDKFPDIAHPITCLTGNW
ncbi:hypothetical protein BDK51DRAFT_15568, partial [Blyttiomyces helicus]